MVGGFGSVLKSLVGRNSEAVVDGEELLDAGMLFVIVKIPRQNREHEVATDPRIQGVDHPISNSDLFKVPALEAPQISALPLLRDPSIDMELLVSSQPEILDRQRVQQVLVALDLLQQRVQFVTRVRVILPNDRQVLLG